MFVVLLVALLVSGIAEAVLSPTEQMYFSTVRLQVYWKDANGGFPSGVGTGFFYRPSKESNMFWIVTNKHVLKHKAYGLVDHFDCDIHEDASSLRPPAVLGTKRFSWSRPRNATNTSLLFHPQAYVDVVAVKFLWPTGGDGWQLIESGNSSKHVQLKAWEPSNIATTDELFEEVVGGDTVLMYGYPHFLYDQHHKLPVVRAGYLASPAYVDYSPGFRHEECDCKPPPPTALGVVDMACFPGSSGSPIVLVDGANPRLKRDGTSHFGERRLRLLGVAFGTIFRKVTTHIKNIPLSDDVQEDLHVAFYWKASEISKLGTTASRDSKEKIQESISNAQKVEL